MKYKQVHCNNCYATHWVENANECNACHSVNAGRKILSVIDESDKLPVAVTMAELFRRMPGGDKLRWVPHPLDDTKHYGRQLWLGADMVDEDAGLSVVGECQRSGLLRELPESDDGVLEYEYVGEVD